MMTGFTPGPGDFNSTKNNNVHPRLGSMVARMAAGEGALPPYISVPCFLRSRLDPASWAPATPPSSSKRTPPRRSSPCATWCCPKGWPTSRAQRRQDALREINRFERGVEEISKDVRSLDTFYERAHRLMNLGPGEGGVRP